MLLRGRAGFSFELESEEAQLPSALDKHHLPAGERSQKVCAAATLDSHGATGRGVCRRQSAHADTRLTKR